MNVKPVIEPYDRDFEEPETELAVTDETQATPIKTGVSYDEKSN
jgi:hypothetical protein